MSTDSLRRTASGPLGDALAVATTGIRFLLAFVAAVAVTFVGARVGDRQGVLFGAAVGFGIPVAFGTVWATYVPESAPRRLDRPRRLAVETAGLGIGVLALYALGVDAITAGFAVVAAATTVVEYVLAPPDAE